MKRTDTHHVAAVRYYNRSAEQNKFNRPSRRGPLGSVPQLSPCDSSERSWRLWAALSTPG